MLNRTIFVAILMLSGIGIGHAAAPSPTAASSVDSDATLSDLSVSGSQALIPTFPGEYSLSWSGGQPPFQVILASEPCPTGVISDCAGNGVFIHGSVFNPPDRQAVLGAFGVSAEARIERLVGTVIDSSGAFITSVPFNVRIGTDDRYFIRNYSYVSFNDNRCNDVRSFSPGSIDQFDAEEAFIRITDETAEGLPVFSWDVISQPSLESTDTHAATVEVWTDFSNTLFALEDLPGGDLGIVQPLAYGDYSRAGTIPLRDPPIPSPPLPGGEQMTMQVLTFGGGCGATRWFLGFELNPPEAGEPTFLQAPADDLDVQDPDPAFAETLERRRRIRLQPEQAAIAACVDDSLGLSIFFNIVVRTLSALEDDPDEDDPDLDLDELVFEIVTDSETRDNLRFFCATARAPQTDNMERAQTATTPDFDLELVSGSGRVTLPDATMVSEIRTAHARVIVSGGAATIDIDQTVDAQRSAIGSPDSPLVVTPNNPALPETTVPPGFFVILSDTSISDPTEFAMFADGFE